MLSELRGFRHHRVEAVGIVLMGELLESCLSHALQRGYEDLEGQSGLFVRGWDELRAWRWRYLYGIGHLRMSVVVIRIASPCLGGGFTLQYRVILGLLESCRNPSLQYLITNTRSTVRRSQARPIFHHQPA